MASDDSTDIGAPLNISPQDYDIAARTMIGEEGTPEGRAAVGAVLLNRARSGSYPNTLSGVALQRGQFESWGTNARRLQGISTNSKDYQDSLDTLKALASGVAPDPTSGATMFINPSLQLAQGRAIPAWATGRQPLAVIGRQRYYSDPGKSGIVAMMPANADFTQDFQIAGQQPPQTAEGPKVGAPNVPGQAPTAAAAMVPGDFENDFQIAPARSVAATPDGDPAAGFKGLVVRMGDAPAKGAPTPAESVAAADPGTSLAASSTGGFLGGIPIAGPTVLDAGNRLAAGIMSLQNGTPFAQEYAKANAIAAANFAAHPTAQKVGGVTGAIAGIIPAIMAAPEAFGIGAGNMLGRVAASGGTNALISGTDAAARGGNALDIARSGTLGAAFGMFGPVAGQAAGALGRWGIPGITKAPNSAENALLDAVGGLGPADLAAMSNRLQANPRLSPMDISDPLQMRVMGIATQPGDGRTVLSNMVAARNATAGDAVSGAYDTALGPTPNVMTTLQGMKDTAAANAAKGFGEALTGARPVNVSEAIRAIDDKLTPGVQKVVSSPSGIPPSAVDSELLNIRARLAGPDGNSMLTDASKLHDLQSSMRQDATTMLKSASGQDRRVGDAISNIRSKIVDAIDEATDGKFKPAQKQYADDMAVQEAFDKGTSVLKNAPNDLQNRPEYWQDWVKNASPAEIAAAKLGARTAVDQKLGGVRNAARTGSTLTDVEFNTDRLKTLLGEHETGQLSQAMQDAQAEYATNQKLFQNTQTAPRLEAAKATAVRPITGGSSDLTLPFIGGAASEYGFGNPLIGAALGVGIPLARRGIQYLGQRADLARNLSMANMLSSTGQSGVDVINRLAALRNAIGTTSAIGAPVNALAAGGGQYLSRRDQ